MRRQSFENLLETDRGKNLVDIGAYCLMPNHFHLLLKEKTENGISLFMQKLMTAYTMYFNKKNGRNGALFQGTFKAEHLANDNYLKYMYSYIHLNPIKLIDPTWRENGIKNQSKTEKFLEQYKHSSYSEYINIDRKESYN
jgi:putative transposase